MLADVNDGARVLDADPFTRFWRFRRNEAAALVFGAAGFYLIGAAITYNPVDPSLNAATGALPGNVFGLPGAITADLLLQSLGWAGVAFAVMLAGWGVMLLAMGPRRRGPRLVGIRAAAALLAVGGLAVAAAGLPAPRAWPMAAGLGGALGDLGHGGLVDLLRAAHLPMAAMLATLLGLLAGVFGLFVSYGVTPNDVAEALDILERGLLRVRAAVGRAFDRYVRGLEDEVVHLEPAPRRRRRTGPADPGPRTDWFDDRGGETTRRGDDAEDEGYLPAPHAGAMWFEAPREPAPAGLSLRRDTEDYRAAEPDRFEPAADVVTPAPVPLMPPWLDKIAPGREAAPRTPAPPAPKSPVAAAPAPRLPDAAAHEPPSAFELPPGSLLTTPPPRSRALDETVLDEASEDLESVLTDFGVKGQVVAANPGPVVTLFEFEPAPGVKSSRVISLADDIARSTSSLSARVAVVPGRNVIGIELPNRGRETVYLRSLFDSLAYEDRKQALPLALGETIGGDPFVADLAKMPHLLIAGTTGSGKSVGINAMILSLMYRLPPERCRFLMIDPKMLELSVYDGIPHLVTPVVTDPRKAVAALKWTVREMEQRYRKMSGLGVRNIAGFNRRVAEALAAGELLERQIQTGFDPETGRPTYETVSIDTEQMPYLVVVIDEMADLMLVAGKEIETAVQRLAQMARAAGIHLITATQRPSVDVITGTIKANFPTRISFQVTSKVDSRTILGEQGAEQLLGQGDLLYMAAGGRIRRLHGPFVSDEEVESVANFFKAQGAPIYLDGVTDEPDPEQGELAAGAGGAGGGDSDDELFDRAVAIVTADRKASTSYLQRRLQIGYNRAATLMERLETEGVVTPPNGAGKRDILAGPPPGL